MSLPPFKKKNSTGQPTEFKKRKGGGKDSSSPKGRTEGVQGKGRAKRKRANRERYKKKKKKEPLRKAWRTWLL